MSILRSSIDDEISQKIALENSQRLLDKIKSNRIPISVNFSNYPNTCTSYLLSVCLNENIIALDTFFSKDADKTIKLNQMCRCHVEYEGMAFDFQTRIKSSHSLNGNRAYICEFPKTLHIKQNRNALRINFKDHPSIVLETNNNSFPIHDISSTGIKARITSEFNQTIASNKTLENCQINIPEVGAIPCTLKISRLDQEFLGAKFEAISHQGQKKLTRYIFQQQLKNQ